jgi:pilus assembly protein CpaF
MNKNERINNTINEKTEVVRELIRKDPSVNSDEDVMGLIEDHILEDSLLDKLSLKRKKEIIKTIFYRIRRDLNILEEYAQDDTVSEIMVNGKDSIFIEQDGQIFKAKEQFQSVEELEDVIRRIGAKVHKDVNELTPILDARLGDGSRVNAVYKNIALNGPILTIRRFPKSRISLCKLVDYGTITDDAADFLVRLVRAGYNIFISGGTSSGKTTFLNALSNYIPGDERVVVIEDTSELQITELDNIVRLECKNANVQGKGAILMKDLIKTSLRMRPNRIIVGEVRGGEVLDMIQAMNTGHDGSLSTGHGNSPIAMLHRLESMYLQAADFPVSAIRRQIAEGIDIMVHLGRKRDGTRAVMDISEIDGIEDGEIRLNQLYEYSVRGGLARTKNPMKNTMKWDLRLQ